MFALLAAVMLLDPLGEGAAGSLSPPASHRVPVALAITRGTRAMDFAGPLEALAMVRGMVEAAEPAFEVYTVGESRDSVTTVEGALQLIPDYTFEDAPVPRILVIGNQERGPRLRAYAKQIYQDPSNDLVLSVRSASATRAGAGRPVPKLGELLQVLPPLPREKGPAYVRLDSKTFYAPDVSAGIDLALHVVQLYFGDAVADETARKLERSGGRWKNPPAP
jgi:transcriptional regulator GlxA family with amidase domain